MRMAKRVLLVDGDALLRRGLSFPLQQAGYEVHAAASAEDALDFVLHLQPDIVLLDTALPGMTGLEALPRLRAETNAVIILLTAHGNERDQLTGFELGADDCVAKPFAAELLLARMKAVLRRLVGSRSELTRQSSLAVGDMLIRPATYEVEVAGRIISLPPRQFALLYELALETGHPVAVDRLLARVWGAEYDGEPELVYVHIRWLRERLERDPRQPRRIVTVRGKGYKLEPG